MVRVIPYGGRPTLRSWKDVVDFRSFFRNGKEDAVVMMRKTLTRPAERATETKMTLALSALSLVVISVVLPMAFVFGIAGNVVSGVCRFPLSAAFEDSDGDEAFPPRSSGRLSIGGSECREEDLERPLTLHITPMTN